MVVVLVVVVVVVLVAVVLVAVTVAVVVVVPRVWLARVALCNALECVLTKFEVRYARSRTRRLARGVARGADLPSGSLWSGA